LRTLVVTVGGSAEPIRTAIEELRPDRVVFLCSGGRHGSRPQVDGEGTPCEIRCRGEVVERRPSLVRQLDLRDYGVEVHEDPDDLAGWYTLATRVLDALSEGGTTRVLADYTGGTKTMSSALVAAALDRRIPLHVTTGQRTNLVKVDFGQATAQLPTNPIHTERALRVELPELLAGFDYPGAVRLLRDLSTQGRATSADRQEWTFLQDLCRTLEAWDRFDHEVALRYLQQQANRAWVRDNLFYRATNLVDARGALEDREPPARPRFNGYEPVWDLVLNADRRAAQGRYDDAVGRIYRALELMAQIRLRRNYQIRTAAVLPERIPEAIRPTFLEGRLADPETGTFRVGLFDSWKILAAYPKDPLGQRFVPREGDLQRALEVRNHSLFAHGFRPISQDDWRRFRRTVGDFLTEALEEVTQQEAPPQLPGPLPDFASICS